MESGVIFSIILAALFFGAIIWLVVYSRRQDARTDEVGRPASHKTEGPQGGDAKR